MNSVYARLTWRHNWRGLVHYRFMVYGKNHEPLVRSTEPYSSRRAAVEAIRLVLGSVENELNHDGVTDFVVER